MISCTFEQHLSTCLKNFKFVLKTKLNNHVEGPLELLHKRMQKQMLACRVTMTSKDSSIRDNIQVDKSRVL